MLEEKLFQQVDIEINSYFNLTWYVNNIKYI